MIPNINLTTLDGALGVLPLTAGRPMVVAGPTPSGTALQPVALARAKDVVSQFGVGGPTVEGACYAIENFGRPVVVMKTAGSTAGTVGTINVTGVSGTSVVTVSGSPTPIDDFEVAVRIITGGTVGTAGITYQESLDDGRTWSPTKALGTANSLAVALSGVTFALAAGTLLAGDIWRLRCIAPAATASDVTAAMAALKNYGGAWEFVYLTSPIDATIGAALDAGIASMAAIGRYRWWIGGTRLPNVGETNAQYQTAMALISAAYSTTHGSLWAGSSYLLSGNPGRAYNYTRSPAMAAAAKLTSVGEHIDIGQLLAPGGPVAGARIADLNNNPILHDELVTPGLDDLRFSVLRTDPDYPGVFFNNPRIFAANGSDFEFVQHRRVFNIALQAARAYLVTRLSKDVLVSAKTGFILESERKEIEDGLRLSLEAALMQTPKASAVGAQVSKTDNLLSTKTLTVDVRVTPLAYVKQINLTVGFINPALRAVQVAA